MKPFEACPVCGGDLEARQVDKLVKGGGNVAALRVPAEVCLHCGERLYSEETVRLFEEVRTKLEHHDTDTFEPIGTTFRVA